LVFSLEFLGSSISLIKLRFQTLNFNFEFQTSFCLKFLLLQTQVFAKRVSSCLDGLLLQHRYCKANFLFLPVLMVCSCNTGIAKRIQMILCSHNNQMSS
jgi:hypothetical protein